MGREIDRLTLADVRDAPPGRHADGAGLYLCVAPGGGRSWLFVYRYQGRRPEIGFGPWPAVSMTEARAKAATARQALARNEDPRAVRIAPSAAPTFGAFATELIERLTPGWRSTKHAGQWTATLLTYAAPIWRLPIDQVATAHVLECLAPIWTTKPETANRVRGRIERVLSAARAAGHRTGDNPAVWRGHLSELMPERRQLSRGHFAAMPYADVPAFMRVLERLPAMAGLCLRFAILTAARSGEALGAEWSEIDREAAVWTVPAARMKEGRVHRVPLSGAACAILDHVAVLRVPDMPYVFPGEGYRRPLSNMAMDMLLRRRKLDITVHGFRSSFRDWAGDETTFAREIVEAALSHIVGDKAEQAYRRGDALRRRRELMDAWAQYLAAAPAPSDSARSPAL